MVPSIESGFAREKLTEPVSVSAALEIALDGAGVTAEVNRAFVVDALTDLSIDMIDRENESLHLALVALGNQALDKRTLVSLWDSLSPWLQRWSEPRFQTTGRQINITDLAHPFVLSARVHAFQDAPDCFFCFFSSSRFNLSHFSIFSSTGLRLMPDIALLLALYSEAEIASIPPNISEYCQFDFRLTLLEQEFLRYSLVNKLFPSEVADYSPIIARMRGIAEQLVESTPSLLPSFLEHWNWHLDDLESDPSEICMFYEGELKMQSCATSQTIEFDEIRESVLAAISELRGEWKPIENKLQLKRLLDSGDELDSDDLYVALSHPDITNERVEQLISMKIERERTRNWGHGHFADCGKIFLASQYEKLWIQRVLNDILLLSLPYRIVAIGKAFQESQSIDNVVIPADFPPPYGDGWKECHCDRDMKECHCDRYIIWHRKPPPERVDLIASTFYSLEEEASKAAAHNLDWTKALIKGEKLPYCPCSTTVYANSELTNKLTYQQWRAELPDAEQQDIKKYSDRMARCIGLMRRQLRIEPEYSIAGYGDVIAALSKWEPGRLLAVLMQSYRATPIDMQDEPTAVCWSSYSEGFFDSAIFNDDLAAGDALAVLIAKRVPMDYSRSQRLAQLADGRAVAMRELCVDMAQYCMGQLQLKRKEKSGSDGYQEDQCKERDACWRQGYLKALEELSLDLGGSVHKTAHFVRENDPDESVRKVAHTVYAAVRRSKLSADNPVSLHRSYLAAFWWIRIARVRAVAGYEFDLERAQRQRRRELRFVQ